MVQFAAGLILVQRKRAGSDANILRLALAQGEFELYYQPILDTKTLVPASMEALLRWSHPKRGRVMPSSFIPLAEKLGLIIPIGEWVLARACADAVDWPSSVSVAVNLSAVQFGSDDLVVMVKSALEKTGLDPCRLELEVTETVMLENTKANLAVLHRIKDLGVHVALDDFGTGYSSLSYLRSFSFDKVKIDQSFTRDGRGLPKVSSGVAGWKGRTRVTGPRCGSISRGLASRPTTQATRRSTARCETSA